MPSNLPESLDTCVVLRIIVGNIPSQSAKAKALISDTSRRFYISDLVFFESVFTLQKSYGWPRRAIATAIAGIFLDRANIECNRNFLYQVLDDYVAHPKLSFADCYLARSAQVSEMRPLWTFDQKLSSQMPCTQLIY